MIAELILPDPNNIIVSSSIPRLKSGSENSDGSFSGSFSINVTTGGHASFNVPPAYENLYVTVTAKGLWGSYRITVTSGGSSSTKGVVYIPYTDNTAKFILGYSGSGITASIDVSGPEGVGTWKLYTN